VATSSASLALYEISDVSPAKVHITLPVSFRMRRAVPRRLVLHYANLAKEDIRQVEGVPVTTAERTIRDAHADHLGPALVRQAIADGRRKGHLTFDAADRLERELLSASPRTGSWLALAFDGRGQQESRTEAPNSRLRRGPFAM